MNTTIRNAVILAGAMAVAYAGGRFGGPTKTVTIHDEQTTHQAEASHAESKVETKVENKAAETAKAEDLNVTVITKTHENKDGSKDTVTIKKINKKTDTNVKKTESSLETKLDVVQDTSKVVDTKLVHDYKLTVRSQPNWRLSGQYSLGRLDRNLTILPKDWGVGLEHRVLWTVWAGLHYTHTELSLPSEVTMIGGPSHIVVHEVWAGVSFEF